MNIAILLQHLGDYPPDTPCAYSLWLPADVRDHAASKGIELTDDQVADTLATMQRRHDASLGLTWDALDAALPG